MKNKNVAKRVMLAFFAMGIAAVIVACGGGQSATETDDKSSPQATSSASVSRLAASSTNDMLTWTPASVDYPANPGSAQDIPITIKTQRLLGRVTIEVVPELRGIVTVTPTSLPSLRPDQTATVTLRFAPGASEAARTVSGTVRILSGTSTVAKPLPVSVAIVVPETIKGIVVPPEPPKSLNDLTLAGIDQNKNGVRDDVERLIAREFGSVSSEFSEATAFSKSELAAIVSRSPDAVAAYGRAVDCAILPFERTDKMTYALLNTDARRNAYGLANAGAIGGDCQ